MDITKLIESSLEALFRDEESLVDCYLIEVVRVSQRKFTVFIDSDTGVTFEKCAQVSRHLEKMLDNDKSVVDDYILDVSSPGVGRPLTIWRQYPKHVGRELAVELNDGSQLKGVLRDIGDDRLTLETAKDEKQEIQKSDIMKSIVQISFNGVTS